MLGGISFYEYRTDDARLTIEVIKEAVNRGATALNYLKATGAEIGLLFNFKKKPEFKRKIVSNNNQNIQVQYKN